MPKSRYERNESDPLQYAFSTTLKELRLKSGYTHQQLADRINVNRTTYTYWETFSSLPSVENVMKLCDAFNISISDFFALIKKYRTEKEKENEQC